MEKFPFSPYDFFGYLISGLAVLFTLQITLGFPVLLGQDLLFFEQIAAFLAAYVVGQVIATPSKTILEDLLVHKVLGPPSVNLFRDDIPRIRGFLFPGFYKPLPPDSKKRVLSKASQQGCNKLGEDLFLFVRFADNIRKDEAVMARLSGFLNLYGFSRNLSFAFIVVAIFIVISMLWANSFKADLGTYAIGSAILGIALFYRYLKFFRQYSYEMFNTYGRSS